MIPEKNTKEFCKKEKPKNFSFLCFKIIKNTPYNVYQSNLTIKIKNK